MTLSSTHLYDTFISLDEPIQLGQTPEATRAIFGVTGGTVQGERINGEFLPSGGEWARIRSDGSIALDVRCCLKTDDGALVHIVYGGRLVVPPELLAKVLDMGADEPVDPSLYYFRSLPLFETASEKYAWLNHICAVGVGRVVKGGVEYSVYAID